MIRPRTAAAAIVLLLGAWAVPAGAAARSCTSECIHWQAFVNAQGQYGFESKWTANSHGYYERGHAICFSNGAIVTRNGGWVTSVGLYSAALCPGGYTLDQGAWQEKTSSGGTITTHWVYP